MKFYDIMYPDHEERKKIFDGDLWNVRAIQLWNDWNVQVHDWATGKDRKRNNKDGIKNKRQHNDDVDYLWMRSEDLLPGSPRRLECLQMLAQFVGSTLTPDQLCCISQQGPKDYGKSLVQDPRKVTTLLGAASSTRSIEAQWHRQERDKRNTKEALLKEKEESLRQWQAALEVREAMLDGRISQRLGPENVKNTTTGVTFTNRTQQRTGRLRRRRLQQESAVAPPRAKIVPSNFIRDSGIWQGLALSALEKDAEVTRIFIVDGLISHGEDLLQQWELNHFDDQSATFDGMISKHEIQQLVLKLQIKVQQARLIAHRKKQAEQRPGDPNVKNRYGKWQGVLSNNTQLARYFYQEGQQGLERFGYHPFREIEFTTYTMSRTFNASSYAGFVCDSTVSCPLST